MGRGSYLGGGTVVTNGRGFTSLPEGGEATKGRSAPTPNQVAQLKRSDKIKARRTTKVRKLRAKGLNVSWMD